MRLHELVNELQKAYRVVIAIELNGIEAWSPGMAKDF